MSNAPPLSLSPLYIEAPFHSAIPAHTESPPPYSFGSYRSGRHHRTGGFTRVPLWRKPAMTAIPTSVESPISFSPKEVTLYPPSPHGWSHPLPFQKDPPSPHAWSHPLSHPSALTWRSAIPARVKSPLLALPTLTPMDRYPRTRGAPLWQSVTRPGAGFGLQPACTPRP
jgi:hypothetical protein